jgi:uncharacterized membrane protein YccC
MSNYDTGSPNPPPPTQQPNALLSGAPNAAANGPRPPSHQETVAALRHFYAIKNELQVLQKNPALGHSSIKSAAIDGATKLVSEGFLTPAAAIEQLSSLPDEPLQQLQWVKKMLAQTLQAANGVLDHHSQNTPASLDWATESRLPAYHRDNHLAIMSGLQANYKRLETRKRG